MGLIVSIPSLATDCRPILLANRTVRAPPSATRVDYLKMRYARDYLPCLRGLENILSSPSIPTSMPDHEHTTMPVAGLAVARWRE